MYSSISRNKRNTVFIFIVFVALVLLLGWLLGWLWGSPIFGLILAGCIGIIYGLIQYYTAGSQVIAMSGALRIAEADNPRLWRTVENLSIATGLPMPEVYIVKDPAPNAFATGRNPANAKVAVTTGLLELLNDAELEGVMAHELGHVKNYDIRVSMFVFGLVVVVGIIADMFMTSLWFGSNRRNNNNSGPTIIFALIIGLIAPLVATVVQLAISRQREYLADATGALITRYPEGLASALAKLHGHSRPMRKQNSSMAHLWIADPMKPGIIDRLFSTHPPIADRIARLEKMSSNF